MKELFETIEYLNNYLQALQAGVNKFVSALPLYTKQHIAQEAKRKLHTTREAYLDAVNVRMDNYILVVELDKDSWIANAVETGADAFNMKKGLVNSSKAKVSKKGHRYLRVPINKDKNAPGGTDKSQEYHAKLNEILLKPKFGLKTLKQQIDGSVVETQKILTNDKAMGGLYRTRSHKSAEAFHSGKSKPTWQYIMFRTVSENPISKTGAKWDHPGIKPVHIFRSTEQWLNNTIDSLLDSFIKSELDKIGR